MSLLGTLPQGFFPDVVNSSWAFYSTVATANLPGTFNRTIFEAPWDSNATNVNLAQSNSHLSSADFLAFDQRFFDIIGPDASIEQVVVNDIDQSQEASCFIPTTNQLFYAEWSPSHAWQYLLDSETLELRNITTDPPTMNVHGCVYHNGHIYVATDGGEGHYASVVKIDPVTLKAETLINNFFQQPFNGFNDIEMDPNGNIWVTDSISAWGRYMTEFAPRTSPAVYFINMTTMTPKWVFETDGNANGIAFSRDGTLYVDTTGVSSGRPNVKDPYKTRALLAYDTNGGRPQLKNARLFSNSISYYNDGVRISRNGYVFGAAGDGVDIIEPEDGTTLGRIRVGGSPNLAINVAFEDHTLWIVGKGGVWRVSNIREQLARDW